jgi:branched-chain amino acid transport system substrate-binding protein
MRKTLKIAATATVTVMISALAACSSSGGSGDPSEGAGEPIVFAIMTSQSGALATLGIDEEFGIKAGVDLATDGTNEIDGRPIEFVVVDDKSDPGTVPGQTRKILQQNKPTIVFGNPSSAAAMASAQVLAEAQVPAIYTIAATADLTGFSPTTFRTSRDAAQEAQMGSQVVDIEEGETFLILAPDYAYGQSAAAAWQALLSEEGGEPASDPIFAPLDARDYTAVAERVRSADPDVLVVVTFAGSGGPTLWQNLGAAGVAEESEVVTLLPQVSTREAMGDVAPQLRYFAIYDPNLEGDLNQEFVEKFRELSDGQEPDIYAGDSGVAAMLAIEAIRKSGSTDPADISETLSGLSGESVKGAYEVRADDHTFLQSFYEASVGEDFKASIVATFPLEDSATPVTHPIE